MILFIDMQNQRDSQFFFQTLSEKKHSQYEWQGKKFKGKSTYSISKLNMYKSKSGDIQQEK